jgi:hypothetical protein
MKFFAVALRGCPHHCHHLNTPLIGGEVPFGLAVVVRGMNEERELDTVGTAGDHA